MAEVATSQTGSSHTLAQPFPETVFPSDHTSSITAREKFCNSVDHGVHGETTQLTHSHMEAAQTLGNEWTHGLCSNKMVFTKAVNRIWLVC